MGLDRPVNILGSCLKPRPGKPLGELVPGPGWLPGQRSLGRAVTGGSSSRTGVSSLPASCNVATTLSDLCSLCPLMEVGMEESTAD